MTFSNQNRSVIRQANYEGGLTVGNWYAIFSLRLNPNYDSVVVSISKISTSMDSEHNLGVFSNDPNNSLVQGSTDLANWQSFDGDSATQYDITRSVENPITFDGDRLLWTTISTSKIFSRNQGAFFGRSLSLNKIDGNPTEIIIAQQTNLSGPTWLGSLNYKEVWFE